MNKILLETTNLKKSFEHVNGRITLFENINLKKGEETFEGFFLTKSTYINPYKLAINWLSKIWFINFRLSNFIFKLISTSIKNCSKLFSFLSA